MKKIFLSLGIACLLIGTALALSSCNKTCKHVFGEAQTVKEAGCETAGTLVTICEKCGEKRYSEILSKGGHVYADNGSVTKTPTCGKDGVRTFVCTVCGHYFEENIPATGQHAWGGGTAAADGTLYTCIACGNTKTESNVCASGGTHTWGGGTVTLSAACGNTGIREYACTKCQTKKTEEIPATGAHQYSANGYISKIPTASAAGTVSYPCANCANRKNETLTYTKYTTELSTAKNLVSSFKNSDFGDTHDAMPTNTYAAPTNSPTAGEHPRVLINSSNLPALKTAFAQNALGGAFDGLIESANDYGVSDAKLGSVTSHSSSSGAGPRGEHNLNENVLRSAACKALLYLLTDTDLYGYEAVAMIKSYITTMKVEDVNDCCRNFGFTMFTAALVYDWCYDLLTDADKEQITSGVQNKICSLTIGGYTIFGITIGGDKSMEVGFPPSGQGAVVGHGSERQILRDYLSYAIAVYDEDSTWYQYVAGRVYQEYVPVRREFYRAGYAPQGISVYLSLRYTADLWSAWLLTAATGVNPYADTDMAKVITSVFSQIVSETSTGTRAIFDEGDDELKSEKEILKQFALPALMSAYLYQDDTAYAWASGMDFVYTDSVLRVLLLTGTQTLDDSSRYDGLDLVCYNAGFESRITVHNKWWYGGTSVYMKIGNRMTANHDHADAGSFQIYYKGLLTGDSGVYDSYGSTHHTKYHQATVAHNSILIYNGTTGYGQNQPSEPSTLTAWQADTYKTGTTTGVSYGYGADGITPTYAYIAGDLTAAYSKNASYVSGVERRMLTVYDTGRTDVPMYFFVYDDVKTAKSTYQSAFLLHTPTEPTVSGNTVTVTTSSSKLVLQNLLGASKIEKLGGTDKNYLVNGSQVATEDGEDDGMWGRVELKSDTSSTDKKMLNVIYVCDAGKNPAVNSTLIRNDAVTGAVTGNTAAVFVTGTDRRTSAFSFTATGSGNLNYYVSGVSAGTWTVSVGTSTQTVTATEDGGLLTFTAPAGTVSVTPNGN